ncbi:MAG: ABC transporter ATP-binding protein [Bacteroidetes bacterium]|nr:ABC transporter ATP-binding protein [Bacteroidota bacterium]
MKLLFNYLKNYKPLVILAMVLAAINQVFSLLDPLILGNITDKYLKHTKEFTEIEFLKGVGYFIGLAIGVAMISRIAKNFQDYFVNTITQKLGAQIYSDGLRHSLQLPFQVFEDQRSGETLGVLQKVRTDIEKLISATINILFTSLVGITWVVVYSASVCWVIGPVYFLTIPILAVVSSVLSKKVKTIQKRIVGETTALAGSTTESLRNIELVKSLGLAKQEIKRLNDTTSKILDLELTKVKYIRSISFIQGTIVNLLRNSILFLMVWLVFKDQLTQGQFITFFIYSFFIFGPLQELGNIILIYREAEVSLQNFEKIMNTPIEPVAENPVVIGALKHIQFNDVVFRHDSANNDAVNHISFEVKTGETIAFVGPSGAGKTSIVKLLVGLYRPNSGSIYLNDVSSKEIDLNDFRNNIGFVTQETQLFSGTIRENLLFVKPDATDEEITLALQQASCQKLLERAENGLETIIGENGIKVSGGEKQRLSIARSLLRKPSLLVFDEATSALDSLTEEEISSTIREISSLSKHITVMIAHRLSTIMHADRIYVLERGKIIETGKHEDLINEKGLYYAMWRQQAGERRELSV